uniref:Uncharacterized protein n=1 Tax=Strongyloides stercoralis TaxID=6248 RepID=A0AAF5DJB1_STRER
MLRLAYYENNQNLSETDFLRANIKRIAFFYNNTVHDTTSLILFEHLFGRSRKPTITENLPNPEYTFSFDINELIKSWPNLAKYVYEVCKLSYKKLDDANISKQGFSSYLINYASKKMLINIPLDARNLQATGTKYLSSYENDKNNKKKLNEPLSLKLSDLSENEMLKFSKILTLC